MPDSPPQNKLRVMKIGGSLFDLPDIRQRIASILAGSDYESNLLVPGGGTLADAIRGYDQTFSFEPAFIHNVAIGTMQLMAAMLAELLELPLVHERMDDGAGNAVLDVAKLLDRVEPHAAGPPLQRNWDVTSDSIAARLASLFGADLLLLKSVTPRSDDVFELVEQGVVDPLFPVYSEHIHWQVINLRRDAAQPPGP